MTIIAYGLAATMEGRGFIIETLGFIVGAFVGVFVIAKWRRLRSTRGMSRSERRQYDRARSAYRRRQYEEAIEIYSEMERYELAAQIAARTADYRQAASLFEDAGEYRRAQNCRERAARQKLKYDKGRDDLPSAAHSARRKRSSAAVRAASDKAA